MEARRRWFKGKHFLLFPRHPPSMGAHPSTFFNSRASPIDHEIKGPQRGTDVSQSSLTCKQPKRSVRNTLSRILRSRWHLPSCSAPPPPGGSIRLAPPQNRQWSAPSKLLIPPTGSLLARPRIGSLAVFVASQTPPSSQRSEWLRPGPYRVVVAVGSPPVGGPRRGAPRRHHGRREHRCAAVGRFVAWCRSYNMLQKKMVHIGIF